MALPLIALQYHEVRLNFEFENIKNLVVYTGSRSAEAIFTFDYSQFGMANASILVDYIYLDSEERRRFAQVGHEYLIEQLQHTGVESVTGINTKLKLGFNHPVKKLYGHFEMVHLMEQIIRNMVIDFWHIHMMIRNGMKRCNMLLII
jgi:hypothetical protein